MKPSPQQAFEALYIIAAQDGRGEALFGSSIELALPAFEKTLIRNTYPHSYIEFPLMGDPHFDILTVYGEVEPGAQFAPGAGFGYQAMFDWFAQDCCAKDVSCGIEVDTGSGETQRAGVYLQYREHTNLVAPFLETIGEADRVDSYLDVYNRMPQGWPPAYIGLFPGRPGTPLRIGGYLDSKSIAHHAEDPKALADAFDHIGFSAYNEDMLARCGELLRIAPCADFQFDIYPDGSLGDVFGLSLSFNETMPREARACMESGYGAQFMKQLESWGLSDDRWKMLASCAFARHVPFVHEDGSDGRFALCILFNFAKVKFKAGVAQPAKFYLRFHADEMNDEETIVV